MSGHPPLHCASVPLTQFYLWLPTRDYDARVHRTVQLQLYPRCSAALSSSRSGLGMGFFGWYFNLGAVFQFFDFVEYVVEVVE